MPKVCRSSLKITGVYKNPVGDGVIIHFSLSMVFFLFLTKSCYRRP